MNFRDLESVRQIVLDATGLEMSYAYDDLVFPEQTVFILQFDDKDMEHLYCYFQEDCEQHARENIMAALNEKCGAHDCKKVTDNGTFTLEESGENMNIHFKKAS